MRALIERAREAGYAKMRFAVKRRDVARFYGKFGARCFGQRAIPLLHTGQAIAASKRAELYLARRSRHSRKNASSQLS